jgi:hypothetical protein
MGRILGYAIGAVVLASGMASATAQAQAISKGTLSGTLFTAGATANATTVPLYMAPAAGKGVAIVTTVCGSVGILNQFITGSTLGNLALDAQNGDNRCVELGSFGIPLPPGEVLTYTNEGAFNTSVRIGGVISKK